MRTPAAILVALLSASAASAQAPDPNSLAESIDRHLERVFRANNIRPAPQADDAEFLRRAYLDITGRIPLAADVHAFLGDKRADKRRRVIDRLLTDPRHAVHFANIWRAELIPETTSDL